MAKLYFKRSQKHNNLTPSDDTVEFLLNYSKALRVLDCGQIKIETLLN